jgi:hypothetical protein
VKDSECGSMTTADRPGAAAVSARMAVVWTMRAFAVHALILTIPLLLPQLYGKAGMVPVSNLQLYFGYADRAVTGGIPYRDYTIEYPPLAVLLFTIPRLLTSHFGLYAALFGLEMLLFDALALYLVAGRVSERAGSPQIPIRLAWYTLFIIALYPFITFRYDLAPTAVAFLAALWWFSGRPLSGGIMTAIGTLLKIFPGCIAGPALMLELSHIRETRLRGVAAFVLTLAIGGAVWWAFAGATSFAYHVGRGLQIESVPAGLLMIVSKITGGELKSDYNHTSNELLAPGAAFLGALTVPCQLGAGFLVLLRFWRAKMQDPIRYAGATVLAVTIFGKVLSPQYLIWMIPFVTTLEGASGHRGRWLFLLSCIATTLIYPWEQGNLLFFDPMAIGLLNIRSALLLGLLAVWVFGEPPTG